MYPISCLVTPGPDIRWHDRGHYGAARFAHNWALGWVKDSLATRTGARESGIAEADLTWS